MDIAVGDTILTRKKHPCGATSFEVLRVGGYGFYDPLHRLRTRGHAAPRQN